jgi:hypothetical protein
MTPEVQKVFYRVAKDKNMPNEKIHWNNEYSLGIGTIDSQHKKLFTLVNRLYDLHDDTAISLIFRSL